MSVATLAKPGTATGDILGDDVGVDGSDFYIKSLRERFQFASQSQDVMGDGDDYPTYENNGLLEGRISIQGAMVASQAVGLADLVDAGKNPTELTIKLTNDRQIKVKALIESISFDRRPKAVFIPVTMSIIITGTDPSAIEDVIS